MSGYDWDAVRSAHGLVDVIGAVVDLKKKGTEYRGLCPFHNERTPSFYVNPDKQFYHCFGCGAHGDVVDFVAQHGNISLEQAVHNLTGGVATRMTGERKAERDAIMTARAATQAAEQADATARAALRWRKSRAYDDAAPHPYIVRKGIEAHIARVEGDKLILPIRDADGVLQSVQTIAPDGGKLFQAGAPMGGGRMMIGINLGTIIVAEGFATGASLAEATADQVCVTFSLGNMRNVARQLSAAGADIMLAADTGAAATMTALAAELDCPVAVPPEHNGDGVAISDFNDMALAMGHDAVAATVLKARRSFAAEKQAAIDDAKAESAPVDLWAKPSPPVFPKGLLPPIIERFAQERGDQMGVDPGGLAMAALTACAGVIRDSIQIKVKRYEAWTESARVWTMLIGDPSYKKSPIMSAACRRIQALDTDMHYRNIKAMAQWQEDGGNKGSDPQPAQPRLRADDLTMESAQEIARHSPEGVIALQDELSGWFGGIEKYSGGKGGAKDRSFWLRAYGGGQYAVNRIARGSFIIDNLSFSILGGVQPDPIRRIVNDATDDGLIQRFLPVVLRPSRLGKDEEASDIAFRYDDLIERLHALTPPDSVMGPLPLQFDDDARKVREALEAKHHAMVSSIEGYNKKLAAHVGKYDGLYPRLCILWHCIEHACGDAADDPLPIMVTGRTAQRVADFLHGYIFKHSLAFYFGTIGLADDSDQLCDIAGYILAHRIETVTMRTLQRGSRGMRKITRDEAARLFEQLEAFGWLEQKSKRTDAPSWAVNPEVHTLFADRGSSERARRSEMRGTIAELSA